VRSLSGHALRRRWQSAFGRSPPEHLTGDLLRRMIANRVQEEAFGTLDRATLKLLDGLARVDNSGRIGNGSGRAQLPPSPASSIARLPGSAGISATASQSA
jgi:hypothetical protein